MKKHVLLCALLLSFSFLVAQDWETMASLPGGFSDARHHPVTFSIGDFGYLLTGSTNTTNQTSDFMRYDAINDTWESLPNFPGLARSFSYGVARGPKAYIGFGRRANGDPLKDLWEYDSELEEWTQLTSCPCVGRWHPAFLQVGDKIFMGMGNNPTNLRDWWEYDIPTDTWTQKDDLPGLSRHHPYHFGIGDKAYVGFGHGNSVNGVLQIYDDWYEFDPATDEWTQLSDFPGEGRVAGTQFDYDGKGYVLSGQGEDHQNLDDGEFWEYDPLTDEWTQLLSHPGGGRWAPGSFVIDNYVYFMCGLSDFGLESDMMRFELEPLSTSTSDFSVTPISVFPNPATSIISFTEDITAFSEVRLVNNYGQVMETLVTNQVNVEAYPSGMYYLQFFQDGDMRIEKVTILK